MVSFGLWSRFSQVWDTPHSGTEDPWPKLWTHSGLLSPFNNTLLGLMIPPDGLLFQRGILGTYWGHTFDSNALEQLDRNLFWSAKPSGPLCAALSSAPTPLIRSGTARGRHACHAAERTFSFRARRSPAPTESRSETG